ncbi:hypothetical protein DYU05_05995 [Mucilaginibacter terrenus]|uniref:Uncharacterized protein n=1 Tax=Mucilaginibacter terrenus TaxID=2482727 RepID=A0A3E2NW07_9SPHI|nr:hypothetical protein [Mucilaginibacter terrenus]RFZ85149.1 hypothetical protein DYU05_05995 [Mucilaginibacter terrenus]
MPEHSKDHRSYSPFLPYSPPQKGSVTRPEINFVWFAESLLVLVGTCNKLECLMNTFSFVCGHYMTEFKKEGTKQVQMIW